MKTLGKDAFSINKETVDLRYVEQIVDSEQTAALSYADICKIAFNGWNKESSPDY